MDDLQPSENEDKSPHSNPDTAGTRCIACPWDWKAVGGDSVLWEWPSPGDPGTSLLYEHLHHSASPVWI